MAVKSHHPQVASQAATFHQGAGQTRVEDGERHVCALLKRRLATPEARKASSFAAS